MILRSPESRKAVMLYVSQILAIFLAFISQKINTNFLTKEEFGAVSWIVQYLVFVHPFFECGFFASGAKLLSNKHDKLVIRRIYGLLVVFVIFFSLLISLTTFFISYLFPYLLPDELVRSGMLVSSFFVWAYVFQYFFQTVLQGAGDIHYLSAFTLMSRFLTTVFLGVYVLLFHLNHNVVNLVSLISLCIAGFVVLIKINPIIRGWRDILPELMEMNRHFGIHIYIGRLVTAPTMQLAPLLVPYFGGVAGSAVYAVGSNLVTPMVQATQSISTSLFKNFSQQRKLKDRLILINFVVLVLIGLSIYLFAPFLIELSANKNFLDALPFMIPLILGGFFQGMWQPFHLFSLARGEGKWIKQQQIVASLIDLVSTLILIPYYGVVGAYWQFFLSRCVRFILTLHNYYRTVKHLSESN